MWYNLAARVYDAAVVLDVTCRSEEIFVQGELKYGRGNIFGIAYVDRHLWKLIRGGSSCYRNTKNRPLNVYVTLYPDLLRCSTWPHAVKWSETNSARRGYKVQSCDGNFESFVERSIIGSHTRKSVYPQAWATWEQLGRKWFRVNHDWRPCYSITKSLRYYIKLY